MIVWMESQDYRNAVQMSPSKCPLAKAVTRQLPWWMRWLGFSAVVDYHTVDVCWLYIFPMWSYRHTESSKDLVFYWDTERQVRYGAVDLIPE